jgi:hypothetical protein
MAAWGRLQPHRISSTTPSSAGTDIATIHGVIDHPARRRHIDEANWFFLDVMTPPPRRQRTAWVVACDLALASSVCSPTRHARAVA